MTLPGDSSRIHSSICLQCNESLLIIDPAISWLGHSLQLDASNCRCLHIYSPARADSFCLEPQTCAADALNRDEGEVPLLLSGERILMHVAFKAEKIECS